MNTAQNSNSCQSCDFIRFTNVLIFKQHDNKTFLPLEGLYEPEPAYLMKVRSLLEVENPLVNEYAGDMRTKINAMPE